MNPVETTHSTPSEDKQEPIQATESDLTEEDIRLAPQTEASTEASEEVTVTD
jgi:hypothetical protein